MRLLINDKFVNYAMLYHEQTMNLGFLRRRVREGRGEGSYLEGHNFFHPNAN